MAFRILAAGNFPAHRTIAEFRQRHLKEFQELFVQVVQIASEAGLLRLGTVAVDGAKVKANASKRKAMSYGRMKEQRERLGEEIEQILAEAAATDAEEDRLYGPEQRGDELPEELRRREDRLAKIEAAMARLEAAQAEEDGKKGRFEGDGRKSPRGGRPFQRDFGEPEDSQQANFTDPESRIMKTSTEGFQQCYVALGRGGKKAPHEPSIKHPASRRMYEKLQSEPGRAYYRRRKAIVEPVYGWIKEILGFRRFSLRGLEEVLGEWNLVCTAVNLKRLHALVCWV